MTTRTAARLAEIAADHLDPDAARRWLALLRPAVQLVPAGRGDPVVARLGGTPELPPGTEWPQWPGQGRLSFVVELDLAALVATGADAGIALPAEGRLLGFYFDARRDGRVVLPSDPDTVPGSRLLHVTGTGPAADPAVELAAVQTLTWPDMSHPALEDAGLDELPDPFGDALDEVREDELGVRRRSVVRWAAGPPRCRPPSSSRPPSSASALRRTTTSTRRRRSGGASSCRSTATGPPARRGSPRPASTGSPAPTAQGRSGCPTTSASPGSADDQVR